MAIPTDLKLIVCTVLKPKNLTKNAATINTINFFEIDVSKQCNCSINNSYHDILRPTLMLFDHISQRAKNSKIAQTRNL